MENFRTESFHDEKISYLNDHFLYAHFVPSRTYKVQAICNYERADSTVYVVKSLGYNGACKLLDSCNFYRVNRAAYYKECKLADSLKVSFPRFVHTTSTIGMNVTKLYLNYLNDAGKNSANTRKP